GRGSRIKAYVIGVDVFGRPDDFNPNLDPIVRIEATRLRSALSAYYAVAPREPIRIVMKPGSYVPSFEWGGDAVTDGPARCSADGRHVTRTIAIMRREASPRGDDPCEAMLIQAVASLLAAEGFRRFL